MQQRLDLTGEMRVPSAITPGAMTTAHYFPDTHVIIPRKSSYIDAMNQMIRECTLAGGYRQSFYRMGVYIRKGSKMSGYAYSSFIRPEWGFL